MRVLFVGPSLYGEALDFTGIVVLSPARQGDIARAVLDGAGAIGLVDGFFEAVAAPWHKEILFALERGVTMLGSSSIGALRAAECAAFGMHPIGTIARDYCSGVLDDDAAVAICHGPAELGYPPLTEPLVNVKPTLDRLGDLQVISVAEQTRIWERACRLHFKDRTAEAMFAAHERQEILPAYREHKINRKAEDARLLVRMLQKSGATSGLEPAAPERPSFFVRHILPELVRETRPESWSPDMASPQP